MKEQKVASAAVFPALSQRCHYATKPASCCPVCNAGWLNLTSSLSGTQLSGGDGVNVTLPLSSDYVAGKVSRNRWAAPAQLHPCCPQVR